MFHFKLHVLHQKLSWQQRVKTCRNVLEEEAYLAPSELLYTTNLPSLVCSMTNTGQGTDEGPVANLANTTIPTSILNFN